MLTTKISLIFAAIIGIVSLLPDLSLARQAEQGISEQPSPLVKRNILGAYHFLDQSQIRDRSGKNSCQVDWSDGDGCASRKIKNTLGEWTSQIYVFPVSQSALDKDDRYLIQDSSMFITAGVAYPLFFLKDYKNKFGLQKMQSLAIKNVAIFKNNNEYNFWTRHPGKTSDMTVVGPLNIGSKLLAKADWFGGILTKSPNFKKTDGATLKLWADRVADKTENPWGKDSYFNIPNDADDTAVAVTLQRLAQSENLMSQVDISALGSIARFRDLGRAMHDHRDTWTPPNSGAYLTWLKDETLPTFGSPETGVMPLGINNVDCVVNANVLLAAGINGLHDFPGLVQADALLAHMILSEKWTKQCAFYYPQRMMFPYALTRAIRDGQAPTPESKKLLHLLAKQILQLQNRNGSFPGGYDKSPVLATALATVSLLNIGVNDSGIPHATYTAAINKSLHWLDTVAIETMGGRKWEPGIFFSASAWSIAQWRSEAYSTAIVLEAFTKFALNYHLTEDAILNGAKLDLDWLRP